jgi:hypothetical protein
MTYIVMLEQNSGQSLSLYGGAQKWLHDHNFPVLGTDQQVPESTHITVVIAERVMQYITAQADIVSAVWLADTCIVSQIEMRMTSHFNITEYSHILF